ncbi:hypothetical protein [Uliginosibacterium sp. H1]|uniref:hypothetical protein n=1 Tax=Uliginosibacterium sp. H1 TaxID=3114757 RepID=UPI002E17BC12|nr:hypothetical protein [Uliginosibacterium sp. H1]
MSIELDHSIVSSRDKAAGARRLAEILGVASGPARFGPFHAVYVNEGLTLDFIDTDEDFPVQHFCFRVTPADFETIRVRLDAMGIPWRGTVSGPMDRKVGAHFGNIYWNEPDGHQWELLTVSYARAS